MKWFEYVYPQQLRDPKISICFTSSMSCTCWHEEILSMNFATFSRVLLIHTGVTQEVSESGCLPCPLPPAPGDGWAVPLLFHPCEYHCLLCYCPWREIASLGYNLSDLTQMSKAAQMTCMLKNYVSLPVIIKGSQTTASYIAVFGVGTLSRMRQILPNHPSWVGGSVTSCKCLFILYTTASKLTGAPGPVGPQSLWCPQSNSQQMVNNKGWTGRPGARKEGNFPC